MTERDVRYYALYFGLKIFKYKTYTISSGCIIPHPSSLSLFNIPNFSAMKNSGFFMARTKALCGILTGRLEV